jgi:hypothetical protein
MAAFLNTAPVVFLYILPQISKSKVRMFYHCAHEDLPMVQNALKSLCRELIVVGGIS